MTPLRHKKSLGKLYESPTMTKTVILNEGKCMWKCILRIDTYRKTMGGIQIIVSVWSYRFFDIIGYRCDALAFTNPNLGSAPVRMWPSTQPCEIYNICHVIYYTMNRLSRMINEDSIEHQCFIIHLVNTSMYKYPQLVIHWNIYTYKQLYLQWRTFSVVTHNDQPFSIIDQWHHIC